jgi:ABC-type glycerol-3-phosphate transport system substrate-binding protein
MAMINSVTLFAGVGQQQSTPGGQTDPNVPVTLDVWCWNPRTNIFSMKTAGEIYKRDHPNFNINIVETVSNAVQSKIVTILSALYIPQFGYAATVSYAILVIVAIFSFIQLVGDKA